MAENHIQENIEVLNNHVEATHIVFQGKISI